MSLLSLLLNLLNYSFKFIKKNKPSGVSINQHTFCMSMSNSGTVWMVDSSLLSFISSSLLLLCVSGFSISSSLACFCASKSPHSKPERERMDVNHGHTGYMYVHTQLVDVNIPPFWEAVLSFSFSGLSSWASTACRSFSSSTSIAMSSSSSSSSCFTPVGFCCSALAASSQRMFTWIGMHCRADSNLSELQN